MHPVSITVKALEIEVKLLSHVWPFAIPWTAACQAPPSMEFSRQVERVGCPFLLQGIFPTWELNPVLPHCRQMLYPQSHQGSPREEGDKEKNKISEAPLSRNFTSQWGSGQRADVFSDVRQRQTPWGRSTRREARMWKACTSRDSAAVVHAGPRRAPRWFVSVCGPLQRLGQQGAPGKRLGVLT